MLVMVWLMITILLSLPVVSMGNKRGDTLNINGIPVDDNLKNITTIYYIFSDFSNMDNEHIYFWS